MFTGNLLALPVFYGVLNVLAFVLWWSISMFLEPFLYGFFHDGPRSSGGMADAAGQTL